MNDELNIANRIFNLVDDFSFDNLERIFSIVREKRFYRSKCINELLIDPVKSFEYQLRVLISRGFHRKASLSKEDFREKFYLYRDSIRRLPGNREISYILVMPKSFINISDQLEVANSYLHGFTFLDNSEFENISQIRTTEQPYIIGGIDLGFELKNRSSNCALKILEKESRSPLTIEEGIALFTQVPKILKVQGLIFAGTRYNKRFVPDLYLTGGNVKVKRESPDYADISWGVPSCEDRIYSDEAI